MENCKKFTFMKGSKFLIKTPRIIEWVNDVFPTKWDVDEVMVMCVSENGLWVRYESIIDCYDYGWHPANDLKDVMLDSLK